MAWPRNGWVAALLWLASLPSPAVASLAVYSGDIGGSPIMLVIESRNAVQRGLYAYDRYRTPIRLKPAFLHDSRGFGMDELDAAGLPAARLQFDHASFHRTTPRLTGTWTDYRSGRAHPFVLDLAATLDRDGAWPGGPHALLQAASTARFQFRVPMRGDGDAITTIEVLDKADGKHWQTLVLPLPGCNHGIDTVQVALVQGRTQLRMAASTHCPGAVFEWDPRSQRFASTG